VASELSPADISRLREYETQGYDFSTLSAGAPQHSRVCDTDYTPDAKTQSGDAIKMLGTALVYFSPNNGVSILGHSGERFVFCRNHEYFDVLYDYYPFRQDDWNGFEARYGVSPKSLTDADKKSMAGALFTHVEVDVASVYRDAQVNENRTIYEAWLKADGITQFGMMKEHGARYEDQQNRLKSHQPLEPYRLLKNNCATPIKENLVLVHPKGLTPAQLFRSVKNHDVGKIIIYPSQRQFRLLAMKAGGESTAFQWFEPASKVDHGLPGHWMLAFAPRQGLLGHLVVRPFAGAANASAAAAEIVYGLATTPLNWLGRLPKLHKLASKKRGPRRALMGVADLLDSTYETFSLQVRYPLSTPWTSEEQSLIRDLAQESLLLEYVGSQFENADVEVSPQE
jgi:hypothetical protein